LAAINFKASEIHVNGKEKTYIVLHGVTADNARLALHEGVVKAARSHSRRFPDRSYIRKD
jgi:hypothetical protein